MEATSLLQHYGVSSTDSTGRLFLHSASEAEGRFNRGLRLEAIRSWSIINLWIALVLITLHCGLPTTPREYAGMPLAVPVTMSLAHYLPWALSHLDDDSLPDPSLHTKVMPATTTPTGSVWLVDRCRAEPLHLRIGSLPDHGPSAGGATYLVPPHPGTVAVGSPCGRFPAWQMLFSQA